MTEFLAVSLATATSDGWRRPAPAALECLGNAAVPARVIATDDGWVAFTAPAPEDQLDEGAEAFSLRLSRSARTEGHDLTAADLGARLADPAGLVSLLPPFAIAHRAGRAAATTVAVDWLGLRQLYWWTADGIAAVSTSARALAALTGRGLDAVGLGIQALVGWQVGDYTLFDQVRAVPPASLVSLRQGSVTWRRYADPPTSDGPVRALDAAVPELAELLRAWQTSYLGDHPDAVLQLTGGHDSRILLAATPASLRRDLRALTLGDDGSPDVAIAADLADRYGLRHQVQRLDQQRQLLPRDAHAVALRAARALECGTSPLALAPLLLAEDHLEQGHRLSGLGGEVARGFYYPGQPGRAETSRKLVTRLIRWRLFSNEAVADELLRPDFLAQARTATMAVLQESFSPGDWLRATDDFYLYHRMRRWAGAHGTAAAVRRHFVNPMFDHRFVQLALAVAPGDKRDSRLLGRILTELDPHLAEIPLDSGLVPLRLGRRTPRDRAAAHLATGAKVARKVEQRLRRSRRPQLGAAPIASLVLAHWRAEPEACRALYDVPALNPDYLDKALFSRQPVDATTISFLVTILAAVNKESGE